MHTLLVVWHVMSAQLVIVPTPHAYNFGTFQDRAFFYFSSFFFWNQLPSSMHPNQCSVVLVTGDTDRSQDTVSMCKAIYHDGIIQKDSLYGTRTHVWHCCFRIILVHVASDGYNALKMLRNHPHVNSRPTLFIIDVDTHDRKINDQQHCTQLLQKIKRQLKNKTLHDVIPIGKSRYKNINIVHTHINKWHMR